MPDLQVKINPTKTKPDPKKKESKFQILSIPEDHFKIAGLEVLCVIFAFLATHNFKVFLESPEIKVLILSGILASVFFSLSIIELLFVKKVKTLIIFAAINSLFPIAVFIDKLTINPTPTSFLVIFSGSALLFICLTVGIFRGKQILSNSISIKLHFVIKQFLPKAITGFTIFLSLIFYLTFFQWGIFNDFIARKISYEITSISNPIIHIWLNKTNISMNSNVTAFLDAVAESKLKKSKIDPTDIESAENPEANFRNLPEALKQREIKNLSSYYKERLENLVGNIEGSESVNEITFRVFQSYTKSIAGILRVTPFSGFLAIILVFFILRIISYLLYWPIVIIALFIYKTLMSFNFGRVSYIDAHQEEITI